MITIEQIKNMEDCPTVVDLFDAYRIYYKQASDIQGAVRYLSERLANNESIILVAKENGKAIGFTQLYPGFSSVSMKPLYTLNDLFVADSHRGKGIGGLLLEAAEAMGRNLGWKGMVLETATDNPAQKLYERKGWNKDVEYFHYGIYF
jgi:GNAT superfamily N-acetyltransferase